MAGGVVCCKALAACDPRERSLQLQPPWTLQRSGRRAEQPVAARFVDCGCYTTHSAWEGRASAPSLAAGHSVRGPSSVGRSGACVQVWQSCASAGEERASARSRRRSRMTGESSGAFVVPNAALPTSGSPARPSRARRSLTPPAARRPARRRPTASYRTSYDKKMSSEKAFVRRTPPRPAHPRRRPTAKIYCRKKFIRPPDRTRGAARRPRAPTHDRTASSGDGASASYDVRYERSYDKKMRKDKHMPLNTRQPRHSRQTIVCGVLARSAPPRLDTSKLQRRRYAT